MLLLFSLPVMFPSGCPVVLLVVAGSCCDRNKCLSPTDVFGQSVSGFVGPNERTSKVSRIIPGEKTERERERESEESVHLLLPHS
uniref:Putative secreted protein n=1 Tax=Anopheles darlingi TaxID=43151 RepID=A0A2M4DRF8_ANODA